MIPVINIVSEIREYLSKDNENISNRFILNLVDQFRAIQIKNEINKNTFIPDNLKQIIKGIELEVSKKTILPFISDNTRILKSKIKIPSIISSNRDLVFGVFSDKLLDAKFNYVDYSTAIYAGNSKFNKKDIYVFIFEDYLYVKLKKENPNIPLLNLITLEAIFEKPIECLSLQYKNLNVLDYPYPINNVLWGYVKSSILKNSSIVINSNVNEEKLQQEIIS